MTQFFNRFKLVLYRLIQAVTTTTMKAPFLLAIYLMFQREIHSLLKFSNNPNHPHSPLHQPDRPTFVIWRLYSNLQVLLILALPVTWKSSIRVNQLFQLTHLPRSQLSLPLGIELVDTSMTRKDFRTTSHSPGDQDALTWVVPIGKFLMPIVSKMTLWPMWRLKVSKVARSDMDLDIYLK